MKMLLLVLSLVLFSSISTADTRYNVEDIIDIELYDNDSYNENFNEHHYYNFPPSKIGTRRFITFTVTNLRNTPLTFAQSYTNGLHFFSNHNCYGVLYPRMRCQITIYYQPMSYGHHNAIHALHFRENLNLFIYLNGSGF